jgi:hypothetical protein
MKVSHILREGYEAFVVDDATRQKLAKVFPPKYPEWIGHHITNRFGVQREENRPFGKPFNFEVIGYAEDDGIEALVVSRDGSPKRPDGKVYHITWSLDRAKGRKPVDSNKVIAEKGYTSVQPIAFTAPLEYLN